MGSPLNGILFERIRLLTEIKKTFQYLHDPPPKKMRPGEIQEQLLEVLRLNPSGENRRAVNEALNSLGYRKVKVEGYFFLKKYS